MDITRYCKQCNFNLKIPFFTEEEKFVIWMNKKNARMILAMHKVLENNNLYLNQTKALINHLSIIYKQCIRCKENNLIGENIECPKCKAFNLNWNISTSFTKEFCTALAIHLNKTFKHTENEILRNMSCNWVSSIPYDIAKLMKKNVNNNKQIKTQVLV